MCGYFCRNVFASLPPTPWPNKSRYRPFKQGTRIISFGEHFNIFPENASVYNKTQSLSTPSTGKGRRDKNEQVRAAQRPLEEFIADGRDLGQVRKGCEGRAALSCRSDGFYLGWRLFPKSLFSLVWFFDPGLLRHTCLLSNRGHAKAQQGIPTGETLQRGGGACPRASAGGCSGIQVSSGPTSNPQPLASVFIFLTGPHDAPFPPKEIIY